MNEVILKTILNNVPRAMPAILQRCDAGIVLENEKIELDFQKAFGSNKGVKHQKEHDMLLLQTLSLCPFQEYVEHPLLEAFVRRKFDRVKVFFWFVTLLPTMLFAGNFWLNKPCDEASGAAPGLCMLTIKIHGQTDLELEREHQLSWADVISTSSCH